MAYPQWQRMGTYHPRPSEPAVGATLRSSKPWPHLVGRPGRGLPALRRARDPGLPGLAAERGRQRSLVRSLHAAGLIDRYTLLICPLTLGGGARLFEGPAPLTEFELTSSVTTPKGVIIAQYIRR
jgi:hypothetical protein